MQRAPHFICAHLDEAACELIRAARPAGSFRFFSKNAVATDEPAALDAFLAAEACFGNVPGRWLTRATRLRWLQLESIGMEYYHGISGVPADLVVTNLKGLFDQPAAETAIAGLLALSRGVDRLVHAKSARTWISLEVRPQTWLLRDKQVIVLGHGSIGRKVRVFLEALGCRVRSFARTAAGAELLTRAELDRALPEADIVVGCLPDTPDTRGLLDRRRLGLLPAHAVLVNVGRGSLVDEAALTEALLQGRVGGAVLDVTREEPIPPSHPLWSCPRTLLLQHTGGGYGEELLDKARLFLTNLAAFESGAPLRNVANLARGY
jgi:phosphoglycerate dehydrogenase-like enzyme